MTQKHNHCYMRTCCTLIYCIILLYKNLKLLYTLIYCIILHVKVALVRKGQPYILANNINKGPSIRPFLFCLFLSINRKRWNNNKNCCCVRICCVLATHIHTPIILVDSCNCHNSTNNDQYQEQYQDHWGVVWRELLVHSCNCPFSSRASMPSIISIVLIYCILVVGKIMYCGGGYFY
jgi:hypothetical protein